MAYTAPTNFVAGNVLTATQLNTRMLDNIRALKDPPTASYVANEASDYTTSSSTFVDVDATNLALTIVLAGSEAFVHFHGLAIYDASGADRLMLFDIDIDGTRQGGDDGIAGMTAEAVNATVTFTRRITGLSIGSHTFKLQWRISGTGQATLYAGAGTSNKDVHPQFWVRELS